MSTKIMYRLDTGTNCVVTKVTKNAIEETVYEITDLGTKIKHKVTYLGKLPCATYKYAQGRALWVDEKYNKFVML